MKKLLVACSMFFAVLFTTNSAQAQISSDDVIEAAGNLINIQGVDVNVLVQDITVQDVVDVTNVLNNNDIDVIVDIIDDITLDNVLNNLLREAEVIKGNQVVVGVVLNVLGEVEQLMVANKKTMGLK